MRHLTATGLFLLSLIPASASPVEFHVTDAKGAAVPDAVVSLVPLDSAVRVTPPAAAAEIMQRGEEFIPYVTPVLVGTAVNFPNRDTVQHHVYSLSKPKKFELPLYAGEAKEPVVFDRPGIVALGCNIHDWMSAYVVVLATPWFAKTDAEGRATVAAAPPGHYRVEVWHPRLAKPETREITISDPAAGPVEFTLALKPDRRIRRIQGIRSNGYR